ncbi:MAG: endonuclease MutS2 [Planctomycetes bacterium]|nr:endonuclease MutS2 [Planctomycetota bacterium]
MNAHTLSLLEFQKIQQQIGSRCVLEATRAAVERELTPTDNRSTIERRRDAVSELVVLLRNGKDFTILQMDDPSEFLHRAHIEDSHLTGRELLQVLTLLDSSAAVRRFTRTHRDDAPLVAQMAEPLVELPEVRTLLARAITEDGEVNDDASPELRDIRRRIRTTRNRIESRLETLVHRPEIRDALASERPSQRGGRLVLQLKANQWTTVGGLVHDRSHTGQTFYVEPSATIELGNELQNLAAEEETELRRILVELTRSLRPWLDDLQGSFEILSRIDLLRAAALFSQSRNMTPADIAAEGAPMEIIEARHPILELALAAEGRQGDLVPLTLRLPSDVRALAVTGSNTGGKTVALKTIGLLAVMAQAGLHVPAQRASLPIFDRVLVDIGDEQSIEQSLSTFSSHMSQIISVLRQATERSLVLLDELGSGTDPAEGGALACSVLQVLAERRATTLVTTHLREVKIFCHDHDEMQNAAMEFNTESLRPTYRLVQGEPGASHALTIAHRLGLPDNVLDRARALLSDEHLNLEQLLARVSEDRRQLREELSTARRERETAQAERQKLQQELVEARKERKTLLREAYRQASGIVDNTKREMQEVVRQARQQATAPAGQIEGLREKLRRKKVGLTQGVQASRERERPKLDASQLAKGRTVYVETMRAEGVVESVNRRRNRVMVNIRGLAVEVSVGDLSQPDAAPDKDGRTERQAKVRATTEAAIELNIIGQRVVEALANVDRFLDQAAVADYGRLTIIHGRGTGALMKGVHEHLRSHPLVASFRAGNETEGGIAVTVVTLKE